VSQPRINIFAPTKKITLRLDCGTPNLRDSIDVLNVEASRSKSWTICLITFPPSRLSIPDTFSATKYFGCFTRITRRNSRRASFYHHRSNAAIGPGESLAWKSANDNICIGTSLRLISRMSPCTCDRRYFTVGFRCVCIEVVCPNDFMPGSLKTRSIPPAPENNESTRMSIRILRLKSCLAKSLCGFQARMQKMFERLVAIPVKFAFPDGNTDHPSRRNARSLDRSRR